MIDDVSDYDLATNRAYEVLQSLHISSLPVDIQKILTEFTNVRLITYTTFCKRFNLSRSDFFAMGVSSYGFTFRKPYDSIVLYDDYQDECVIRFTLAHELGHLFLLHTKENPKSNREANCFARNFLCPIPVINSMRLDSVEDYVDIFNVSPPMAETSLKMRTTDLYHISGQNYNAIINLFSLRTLTKEAQLSIHNTRFEKCLSDFANAI